MTEKRAAERFIYQALSTDPALVALVGTKIGRGFIPQSTPTTPVAPPYVIFSLMSAIARNALPATIRIWMNCVFLVKGVVKGDQGILPAFTVEDRIEALLVGNSGTVTTAGATFQVGPFVKETDIEYDEVTPEGTRFIHSGGTYRAWVYRLN